MERSAVQRGRWALRLVTALVPSFVAASAVHAGGAGPEAPPLPLQWTHGGYQTLAFPLPPWDGDRAPIPSVTTAMESAYDWSRNPPAMRETYHDACVAIFPKGSMWSCDFVNVNGASYLLQHDDRPKGQPECCVFLKPWSPPRPSFAGTLAYLRNTTAADGVTVMWWQSTNVSVSEGGPFGYGWRVTPAGEAGGADKLTPHAFYFGAFWTYANGTDASAFTLQVFEDFEASPPPPGTFDLPPSCASAKACTNWPALR